MSAALAILSGCDPFDESPEWYVQGLKPDLYYTWEIPQGAVAATVWFVTTKPAGPTLPIEARVLTWLWPGGNIYDDSLADTTLKPTEREESLLFSGSVLFPPGGAQAIGVELRTFLSNVAWNAPLQSGGYCDVDTMGAGILNCGEWIEAVLRLWAQCRGVVGQLVRCDSQHSVLVPRIHLVGVRTEGPTMAEVSPREYPFLDTPELLLYATGEGWWYRADHRRFRSSSSSSPAAARGPFVTAEEAARDASERMPLPPRFWDDVLEVAGANSELGRAAATLRGDGL